VKTRLGWALAILAVAASMGQSARAGDSPEDVQAKFVYRLASYVTWPAEAFASPSAPVVIAVVDDPALAARIREHSSGQALEGRAFEVRAVSGSEPIPPAHIVYFGASDYEVLKQGALALSSRPVLRVAATPRFARVGDIGYEMLDGRVSFSINEKATNRGGLRVSSKLMRLASSIE
jgi:hypothetical protein